MQALVIKATRFSVRSPWVGDIVGLQSVTCFDDIEEMELVESVTVSQQGHAGIIDAINVVVDRLGVDDE